MDNAPLLEVEDLEVTFRAGRRTVHAVRGVDLAVAPGEVLGIVGESGSGKTVTALALIGLLPVTASVQRNALTFEGEELDERRLSRIRGDRIAIVFQNPLSSFNPVQRIGTQISEALVLHRRMGRRAALAEAVHLLERVGVPNAQTRVMSYPHEFSGGMLQRAMIAMAVACRPALLIADEPTTALDVTVQAQVLELFASLRAEFGMSLILITHSLAVVANVADRVAVMYAGRVVESGPVADVLGTPTHPYTEALLRAVPQLGSGERLAPIAGQPPDLVVEPTGCAYRPRCARAGEECELDPRLTNVSDSRQVACWKAPQTVAQPPTRAL